MPDRTLHIGIVTDEVSRTLTEALDLATSWGIARFELREGGAQRFPGFTREEIAAVEAELRQGAQVTAVSPGIFKGAADDQAEVRRELDDVLPRSIELAARFACPCLIIFGFGRYEDEPEGNRIHVLRAFEEAAEKAAAAGMVVAIENEPDFWIDQPEASAALLDEIGHPHLQLNWDPANLHWGGTRPMHDHFQAVLPHLANLHVKDYYPDRPEAPWLPVGEGVTPWDEILPWVVRETDLPHVTIETHCEPLAESSRRSLTTVQRLLDEAGATHHP